MARHKEFNKEEALEKATIAFWRYGYEGTSIQRLVDTMGINRGSLYDTFGDKRSLFQQAISHYDRTIVKKLILALEADDAGIKTIIDCFEGIVARAVADRDRKGCFLTNTAVELCPHDPETTKRIAHNLTCLENAFKKALTKAKQKGEISGDRDIQALASFLTSSLQGLRVFSKVNPDPQILADIARVSLSVLN